MSGNPQWRKANRCGGSTTCVEAARTPDGFLLPDSTVPESGHLTLSGEQARSLLRKISRA